jgi:hypothetical protein
MLESVFVKGIGIVVDCGRVSIVNMIAINKPRIIKNTPITITSCNITATPSKINKKDTP